MLLSKVLQSASDRRTYRAIRLANELQCLLVSDKDAQKSAASLSVGVGSFLDPIESQGLAHYLQHMLFMGTKCYPEQNQYSSFLSLHGGSSNAYTSQEQTNFHFEVTHDAYHGALHRFAQFFICPLMKEESSEKQLCAVDSQHNKNLLNDDWRKYQLTKHLSKENHPNTKFSTGDKSTLSSPNLRAMLTNFYTSYYSANLMKLVVYGRQDIEKLHQVVNEYFSQVPNNKYTRFQLSEQPYGDKMLQKVIKILPITDVRKMELSFVLPNNQPHYRSHPGKYVAHLVGHQGTGSLLSWLIKKGLASELSSYFRDQNNCYTSFDINITLTEAGLNQSALVISSVFEYINMLKNTPPQEWVVKEIQRINKIKFDFLDKKEGANYCTNISRNMHHRPLEELLRYPYLMDAFQPQTITLFLNQLIPANLFVLASAKAFEPQCTETEPVYKTKYCVQPLPHIERTQCQIRLPDVNHFIPQDVSVLPLGTELYPKLIVANDKCEAYFKEDHQFALPKVQMEIRFYHRGVFSPKQQILKQLYNDMLKEKLRQFTYMAETASLGSSVTSSVYYQININVYGFRDSLHRFLSSYLSQIMSFYPQDDKLFNILKQKLTRKYKNYFLSDPYTLAYRTELNAMRDKLSALPIDKLSQISRITLFDLQSFSQEWKKQLFSQMYISGNLTADSALQLVSLVQKHISVGLSKSMIGEVRCVSLPLQRVCVLEEYLKNPQEDNGAYVIHYQHKQSSVRSHVIQTLIKSFIQEPAFNYLRTQEQLGYIVFTTSDDHRGVMGISLIIQSSVKNSFQLRQYVHTFFHTVLREKITSFTNQNFQLLKKALLQAKMQKDKNLSGESSRFWSEIIKHQYKFERKELQIVEINSVSLEEFKMVIEGMFYTNVRALEVHQIPAKWAEECKQIKKDEKDDKFWYFNDVNSFKKRMQLYPDFYSHL